MSKDPSWTHSFVGERETKSNMKETTQAVMNYRRGGT